MSASSALGPTSLSEEQGMGGIGRQSGRRGVPSALQGGPGADAAAGGARSGQAPSSDPDLAK